MEESGKLAGRAADPAKSSLQTGNGRRADSSRCSRFIRHPFEQFGSLGGFQALHPIVGLIVGDICSDAFLHLAHRTSEKKFDKCCGRRIMMGQAIGKNAFSV